MRAVNRELREKHWFSSQPSTNDSHTIKELFAQFRAEVALQSLANFRVHRTHFLTCQCATPVSICQSICERLFSFADFPAAEEIKKFNSFQHRFSWMKNDVTDFFVGQIFRDNHRDVA